jgi:ABC-2 type transport system ATP-binding protein
MTIPLEAVNLSRRYGEFEALRSTDLALEAGDLVVLSGPNGSGKSTLLLCLCGLLRPTTGQVKVAGFDLYEDEQASRARLAYVPDVPVFYQALTAWEHLYFIALAHGVEHSAGDDPYGNDGQDFETRAECLLRSLGLWEARDLYPHAYSRGMRLKLGLALALIRPFDVLLLDEPTSALDEESVELLASLLQDLRETGRAVLLTTHDPDFVRRIDARVWRMADGTLTR